MSARIAPPRVNLVLGAAILAAALCGALAARSPVLALEGLALAAIAAVVIADLTVGIIVFTVASFGDTLSLGGAATAGKAVGILLIVSWTARVATAPRAARRDLLAERGGLIAWAAIFLTWNVLSAAWAHSPATALSGASRYAQDMALLPILYTGLRTLRHIRWVLVTFVIGALLSVLYGALTGSPASVGSRLSGALGDPNETAMVLVAAATLALALAAGERRGSLARSALILAGVASLGGLIATGSRGGLVALAATAVTGILLAGRWRGRAAAATVVLCVVGIVWFLALAPAGTQQHVSSSSSTGRTTLWTVAARAISSNPIVGLGNDNFRQQAKYYLLDPGVTTGAPLILTTPKVAHNIYLEIWSDVGVVGLALFIGLLAAALRCGALAVSALRRAGNVADELVARGVIIAIVGMLAADFFISDIYGKQLWLMLALTPALAAAARAPSSAGPVQPR